MIREFKNEKAYQIKNSHIKFHNVQRNSNFNDGVGGRTSGEQKQTLTESLQLKKLLTNQILTLQPDNDFARLLPHLKSVSLKAGDELYKPGENNDFVYFPEDAVFSQLHVLANGDMIEVAMIGREGAIGLSGILGSHPQVHSAQATIAGSALKIKTETLRQEFQHNKALQALLLDYLSAHITQISQRVICNIHHTAEERLCSWLLMLQDRCRESRLPLTQEQVAKLLGVHRPSVTHIAQNLRQKQIINYVRGYINILSRQRLEETACECYSIIEARNSVPCLV